MASSPSVQFTAWAQILKLFAPVVQVKPVTAAAGAAPATDRTRPDPSRTAATAALTRRLDADRRSAELLASRGRLRNRPVRIVLIGAVAFPRLL